MSDALERLKNRNRPIVPDRDASINAVPPDIKVPRYPDTEISRNLDIEQPIHRDIPSSSDLEAPQPLEMKQSTMRLERSISDRLQGVCRDQGICREVLIEAMFEYCEAHPETLAAALAAAQTKQERRQQGANQKRAKAMMEKFGQS
jgi:hypothetical protein